jgi:hypothetical protein
MARFDLDAYETVESRLARFWADHANGRVLTDLVFHDDRRFIMKAEIYFDGDDGSPVATGYAEEIVGASPVNKTSACENAETSAIGRALANCNYSGMKRPSREEMEKVERYDREPRKPSAPSKTYTPEEIARLTKIIEEIEKVDNVATLRQLWANEASNLEIPVNGTTLKDALNARVQALQ